MNSEQWQRFIAATKTVGNYPIFLDDTPALSVLQLRTKCRRLYREHKIELILVDYLQLMTSGVSIRGDNRVQEISYISRGLKELARELSIPIIAGAQLSRAVEQRMQPDSDRWEDGFILVEDDVRLGYRFYRQESSAPVVVYFHAYASRASVECLSPVTLSAQERLTSELLRTL